MFAIVDIAGFQEKVQEGDVLHVPTLDAKEGATVTDALPATGRSAKAPMRLMRLKTSNKQRNGFMIGNSITYVPESGARVNRLQSHRRQPPAVIKRPP